MTTAQEMMQQAQAKIEANRERAKAIGAIYKFELSGDGGGTWIMDLKDEGSVKEADGAADCTVKMSASDYVDMMEGRAQGQMLFMMGKLQVEGDVALALKLQGLAEILK